MISNSSTMRSMTRFSRLPIAIISLANGSYLRQARWKASKHSLPTRIFYSEAEAAKPSRIIAMKRFRKTRLTIRMKATK